MEHIPGWRGGRSRTERRRMVPLLCLSVVNAVSRRSPCAPQQAAAAQRGVARARRRTLL